MAIMPRRTAFAEESAEVEVLFANMEKLRTLTKKIQGSLNRLDTSGKHVQMAIGPIYGNTQKLHVTNSNIQKTMDLIERLRAPLDQTHHEESIIRSDPRRTGIPEYVTSLERATRTLAGLQSSSLKSNQLATGELNALIKYGARQLEEVFRDTLRQDSNARFLEPLHYLTKEKPFPMIPSEDAVILRPIHRYFSIGNIQDPPSLRLYADFRGEYISRSLQNLASASISTARKQNADALYRRGTSGIGTYAAALEGMTVAEFESIQSVFSQDQWGRVCLATGRAPLDQFSSTVLELNSHVQGNMMTDCFLAYEIMEIMTNLSSRLTKLVPELKAPLNDVGKPIRDTAKASLARMLEDTKNRVQSLITLPAEGSVAPVTLDVMTRLQTLCNYLEPISVVMASLGDGGWTPSSPTPSHSAAATPSIRSMDVNADGGSNIKFAQYVNDTLETLVAALDSRARLLLKSQSVQAVFMCNNIAIIESMTQSSDLASLAGPVVQPRIDTLRSKHLKLYLNSWSSASSQLLDVQYTNRSSRPTSGGVTDSASVVRALGSKEKDTIKEKFRNFNAAFDDLIAKHKSYRMEKEVRTLLGREVQRIIEPLYGRFWDRYHDIDKGKGKYVKYDKAALATVFSGVL